MWILVDSSKLMSGWSWSRGPWEHRQVWSSPGEEMDKMRLGMNRHLLLEGLEEAYVLGRGTWRTQGLEGQLPYVFRNCRLRAGVQHVGWVAKTRLEELAEAKSRRILGGMSSIWVPA